MQDGERSAVQYDAMAERYAQDTAVHPINALYDRPAMLDLVGDVHDLRILEIGCAAGALTSELADRGAHVMATDVSPEMIRLARAALNGRASVPLPIDATEPLPFADASFDMIVSSLTLHYIEHWEPVLREFRRVLIQGGVVAFSTHHPALDWEHTPDDYFATRLVTEQWTKSGTPYDVSFWRRPLTAMTSAIAGSGFVIERLVEPTPSEAIRELDPEWHAQLSTKPRFLYFRLIRA